MRRSTPLLLIALLSALALFVWGCPGGGDDDDDDDDSAMDDDDATADDDDSGAGDDDDATDDDDDATDDDDSSPPEITSSVEYSECLGGGQPSPAMTMEQDGDDLLVHLAGWELNCCLEMAVEAILDGDVVKVYLTDHGPPCDCICGFDVDVTVTGLLDGAYDVVVFFDGGAVANGFIEVG